MPAKGQCRPLLDRWNEKVQPREDGCWIWTGHINGSGYGALRNTGTTLAHRAGYEMLRGPIPDGLQLDHLCRVRACVNPAHMEPVTNRENVRRSMVLRMQCLRGHPYSPENIEWAARKYGPVRVCKQCRSIWARRYESSLLQEVKRERWRRAWRARQGSISAL